MAALTVCTGERKLSVKQSCRAHTYDKRDVLYISHHVSISPLIPKDKLHEAKLPIAADNAVRCTLQRGGHVDRL